ncbi:MAG: DUF4304 domain-containing protein [Verrucomicrobiota bacterium]
MIETLKEHVVPVLRERGFKGLFPHFRRPTERAIHLLTFQFGKWGGGFAVEIAACPPVGVTVHWGEHIPPAKVKAWDVARRHRLGAAGEKSDHWFRYEKRGGSCLAIGSRAQHWRSCLILTGRRRIGGDEHRMGSMDGHGIRTNERRREKSTRRISERVPSGTLENSPAIHRWVRGPLESKAPQGAPQGRQKLPKLSNRMANHE